MIPSWVDHFDGWRPLDADKGDICIPGDSVVICSAFAGAWPRVIYNMYSKPGLPATLLAENSAFAGKPFADHEPRENNESYTRFSWGTWPYRKAGAEQPNETKGVWYKRIGLDPNFSQPVPLP